MSTPAASTVRASASASFAWSSPRGARRRVHLEVLEQRVDLVAELLEEWGVRRAHGRHAAGHEDDG